MRYLKMRHINFTALIVIWTMVFWTPTCAIQCGGTFTTDKGELESPNYPSNYSKNEDCTWNIQVTQGSGIMLKFFPPFKMEARASCNMDYVQVTEIYPSGQRKSVGKWCGSNIPPDHLSRSNKLEIKFKTDGSNTFQGFSATWEKTAIQCGGRFTADKGELETPNYPSKYGNNEECTWNIQVAQGSGIMLKFFPPFRMETHSSCTLDYVQVTEIYPSGQRRSVGKWCGSNIPPDHLSRTNKLEIKFKTDGSSTFQGFSATWEKTAIRCGGRFTADKGELETPNYPSNYGNNEECTWNIQVTQGSGIMLKFFPPFRMETHSSCTLDYVQVTEIDPSGQRRSVGKWCGSNIPPDHLSRSNKLEIKFKTDGSSIYQGFSATWEKTAIRCGGRFTADKGELETPNYPSNYGNNEDCTWNIQVTQGSGIMLKFFPPFRMETVSSCTLDYVQVTEIDPSGQRRSVGKWCGSNIPPDHLSRSNKLEIKFKTDGSSTFQGFSATWEKTAIRCGGRFTADKGELETPNYPSKYGNNEDCTWNIQVTQGSGIMLKFFPPFRMETVSSCTLDYVQVTEIDPSGKRTSVGKWCGSNIPPDHLSRSNKLEIKFKTDGSSTFQGFSATWEKTDVGCNQKINNGTGHIFTPNYPANYPESKNCHWKITPPSGTTVTLRFDAKFDLELSNDCAWDYVEMKLQNKVLGKWCGTDKPKDVVVSSGQTLYVKFKSDNDNTGKGFYASWVPT